MDKRYRPWLKALSGLFINISAAWFALAFIGPNVAFPKSPIEFVLLTSYMIFGILFLVLTVFLERGLEK